MLAFIASLIALILSPAIHELSHYIAARACGFKAKLGYSSMGLCVSIPGLEDYGSVFELPGNIKIKYVLTGIAPYTLLPLYYLGYAYGLIIKPVFELVLLYHLFSLPFEFYQKNKFLPLIAGALQVLAVFIIVLSY